MRIRFCAAVGVLLALTLSSVDAKSKRVKAKPTLLNILSRPTVPVPKCTLTPYAPELTLEQARGLVYDAYQTHKVDRQRNGKNIFDEYFAVKDMLAAKRLGLTLREYAVDKVEDTFLTSAARMFVAMKADGLQVGVTSGYRDAERQASASGRKSGKYSSFHGSRPELGGKGLALDIVAYSDDGRRDVQLRQNPKVWAWVDRYGKLFGVGRPYGNRDAPHIGPTNGPEYIAKRGGKRFVRAKSKLKARKTRYARR